MLQGPAVTRRRSSSRVAFARYMTRSASSSRSATVADWHGVRAARTHGDLDRPTNRRDGGRRVQVLLDAALDSVAARVVEAEGEGHKFVASDTRHNIRALERLAERSSHSPESGVPSVVPVVVVELLHVVDIKKEEMGRGVLTIGQLQDLRAHGHQASAVSQPGEFVSEYQFARIVRSPPRARAPWPRAR